MRSAPLKPNTAFQIEPSVEPIGHGRCAERGQRGDGDPARGRRRRAAAAEADEPAPRRRSSRSARPAPGAISSASNSFTLNARPEHHARPTGRRRRGRPATRPARRAASSRESIVSLCAVRIAAGSTARASAAPRPARRPNRRRTRSYSSGIAAIPASDLGEPHDDAGEAEQLHARHLQPEVGRAPCRSRPARPARTAPKKKLCHDWPMLRTAAS